MERCWQIKQLQYLECAATSLATEPFEIRMRLKIAWENYLTFLHANSLVEPYLISQAEEIRGLFLKNKRGERFFYNLHGTTLSKIADKILKLTRDVRYHLTDADPPPLCRGG